MSISEIIKTARESLGMTQEDLAEKLEVSRQAVSKWEQGASVPSPENLRLLEEALGVSFPKGPGESSPQATPRKTFWTWKKGVLLFFGVLLLTAVLSIGVLTALTREGHTPAEPMRDERIPAEPVLTGISFFDENAAPLRPDLGDGWYSFTAGERVLMVVEFRDGIESPVTAVSLFLTPTGTETFDLREQLAVQAVWDGRQFALFALDVPEDLMGHMDVVLEYGGAQRVAETLNVAAVPPLNRE